MDGGLSRLWRQGRHQAQSDVHSGHPTFVDAVKPTHTAVSSSFYASALPWKPSLTVEPPNTPSSSSAIQDAQGPTGLEGVSASSLLFPARWGGPDSGRPSVTTKVFHSFALEKFCSPGLFKRVRGEPGKSFSVSLSFLPDHTSASGYLSSTKVSPVNIMPLPGLLECSPLPLNCLGLLQEVFLSLLPQPVLTVPT